MKLPCELQTAYPGGSCNSRRARAIIMITNDVSDGRSEANRRNASQLSVYTQRQDRRPLHYKLAHLRRVFTRHVSSGRATISFLNPAHDLHVRADSESLTAFLAQLRQILGSEPDNQPGNAAGNNTSAESSLKIPPKSVSRLPASDLQLSASPTFANKSLHVKSTAEYLRYRRQLPAGLQQLVISGLMLRRVEKQLLAQLKQLQKLDLSGNALTRVAPFDVVLPQLFELNLAGNKLTRLEPLSSCPADSQLAVLDVSGNQLQLLPPSLAHFQRLHTLNAANNCLLALPECLVHLRSLRSLNVSNNRLVWIDRSLETAPCLEVLDMHANRPPCVGAVLSPGSQSAYSSTDNPAIRHIQRKMADIFDGGDRWIPSLLSLSAVAVCRRFGGFQRSQRHLPGSLLHYLQTHSRCRVCGRWCCWLSTVDNASSDGRSGSARAQLVPGPLRLSRAALTHPSSGPLLLLEFVCWWCHCLPLRRKRPRLS